MESSAISGSSKVSIDDLQRRWCLSCGSTFSYEDVVFMREGEHFDSTPRRTVHPRRFSGLAMPKGFEEKGFNSAYSPTNAAWEIRSLTANVSHGRATLVKSQVTIRTDQSISRRRIARCR
jgi:hypothetical protein